MNASAAAASSARSSIEQELVSSPVPGLEIVRSSGSIFSLQAHQGVTGESRESAAYRTYTAACAECTRPLVMRTDDLH